MDENCESLEGDETIAAEMENLPLNMFVLKMYVVWLYMQVCICMTCRFERVRSDTFLISEVAIVELMSNARGV